MTELTRIREGMTVRDLHGDEIGTVKFVQFSDEDPYQPGPETVSAPAPEHRNSFMEDLADVFAGERDLPEELRKRLMRHGYIRINTGLLSADRIAIMDQVIGVTDEEVHLTADSDELVQV